MIKIKCDGCEKTFQDENYENAVSLGKGPEEDLYECPNCNKKFRLDFFPDQEENADYFVPIKKKPTLWKRLKDLVWKIMK